MRNKKRRRDFKELIDQSADHENILQKYEKKKSDCSHQPFAELLKERKDGAVKNNESEED